jgi:hypothetical protein
MVKHYFDKQVAKDYDIQTAIFLECMAHWTEINLNNNRNIHDGLCWVYNTVEAWQLTFNYLSTDQINRLLKKLLKKELLVKGNYNKTKYDRTNWYAMTPQVYEYYNYLITPRNVNLMCQSCDQSKEDPAWLLIWRNRQMEFAKSPNEICGIAKPIPVSEPVSEPVKDIMCKGPREISTGSDINPLETYTNRFSGTTKNRVLTKERKKQNSSANEFAQAWELFWKAYPVKKNKSRAMTTFKSKKLYKQIDVILKHIEQSTKTDKKWLDGYIPHPSTYLNNKRWEDEIETVAGLHQSPSKTCVSNNIIEPLESRKPISKDFSNSYMKNFKSA